jgi:hypothetical protein
MRSAPIDFVIRTTLPFLILALSVVPAIAQDRLIVGGQAPTAEVAAIGHFGDSLGVRPDWTLGPFIGGGRFALGDAGGLNTSDGSGTWPIVREVATGAVVALAPGQILAVDPVRSRVFVMRGRLPALRMHVDDIAAGTSVALAEMRPFPTTAYGFPITGFPEVRYAQNADALFIRRANAAETGPEIAVVDVDSGALLRTLLDIGTSVAASYSFESTRWLSHPSGTSLVAHRGDSVEILSGADGTTVATAPVTVASGLGGPFTTLFADWAHDRVFAVQGSPNNWVISPVATGGVVAGEAGDRGYCPPQVTVSAHSGRGYLLHNTGSAGKYYGPIFTDLLAFDAGTLRVLARRDITAPFGFNSDSCGGLRLNLATAPGPPRNLTGTVAGGAVTLTWTNVGDASNFVLDAGIAPGRTDVTFGIGAASPVTFANAPPGAYYLRVRGTNAFGVSRPSNEVAVTVP